jgi:hypothetical protein
MNDFRERRRMRPDRDAMSLARHFSAGMLERQNGSPGGTAEIIYLSFPVVPNGT